MKKALALIVILAIPTVAHAREQVNAGYLTINSATNRAVSNSRQLRALDEQIELLDISERRAEDTFWASQNAFTVTDIVQREIRNMQLSANRAFATNNARAQRETLQFVITNHFTNILLAQNELQIFDAEIALLERELVILELMLELGMGSSFAVRQATHNLNQQNQNRASLEIALNQTFVELNRIMGAPLHHVYNVVFDVYYSPLNVVNINSLISLHDRDNVNIQNARRQVTIAREQLQTHNITSNQLNPVTGEIIPGQVTRRELEIELTQAERNVTVERENSENRVRDIYTNIRQLELNIEGLYLQIELLEMNLELMEEQFLAGQITRIDIDRAAANLLRLEESLRNMKANHHILTMQLENPHILF